MKKYSINIMLGIFGILDTSSFQMNNSFTSPEYIFVFI